MAASVTLANATFTVSLQQTDPLGGATALPTWQPRHGCKVLKGQTYMGIEFSE